MSWSIDYSDWRIFKRFEDLNAAYEIGLREAPAAIYAETSYHVEEFLKGILPALLQMCIVQAASTAIGAGIGAGLGAFVFGAGAIPGAAIGAELGFDLGLAILGWLGLAFLAIAIGHSLGELVVLIKAAVVQAWGAADKGDSRGQHVRQAGQTLARAIAILVRLILTGIVAWLTKKGIDKAPELIAELKASKLGVGFAEWVEKNLGKLTNDPKLRGHAQGEGATTKLADSTAQSPSQLAKKQVEEVPPPPPPPPKNNAGAAKQKYDQLPKTLKKKTVATDGETNTLSGYSADKPEGFTHVDAQRVMDRSNEIGHELRNAGAMDQGVPGQYSASHAEKQLILENPAANNIDVSRPMCTDCQSFFSAESAAQNRPITVTDPEVLRTFNPDGSVVTKPIPGGN